MSKFSDKFVDGMSLVAEKVDENKFLGAIKDSFTIYMPFVIVGSFMNLFNTILCSTTTGLAKWIPALEALKPIFTAANFATLSCMTLPIVFLIGLKLGKKNNVPEHISAIMALASYLTICPQIVSVVVDDKTGTASGLPGAALGSQGLFVGMLVAILASQLFAFLMTFDKLKIKMPASVPTAITTSFNALIPIVLTPVGCFRWRLRIPSDQRPVPDRLDLHHHPASSGECIPESCRSVHHHSGLPCILVPGYPW